MGCGVPWRWPKMSSLNRRMNKLEKSVLVLGASATAWRYSYMAAQLLLHKGYPTCLIGKSGGEVNDVPILKEIPNDFESVHTVTLYLNPAHQPQWEHEIEKLAPRRVIFNPGTENPDWMLRLEKQGIEVLVACTLVLIKTAQF